MSIRRFSRIAVCFAALATASACAFTPHEVSITAEAATTPSSIGDGVSVAFSVVDDRDDLVVGQRGVGMQGADITANGLIPAVEKELKEGIEAKGFRVISMGEAADADFTANLRAFKFFIESGFWTGAENTNVAIRVEAKKGNRDFKRMYRSDSENRAMVVPTGEAIDAKLNAALTDVLTKILEDEELMKFLAL